jgi:hypothetical protein
VSAWERGKVVVIARGCFVADDLSPFLDVDLPRLLGSITSTISPPHSPTLSPPGLTYKTSNSRTSSGMDYEQTTPPEGLAGLGGFSGPSRPMSVYTRMISKSGRETLFELRGHASFGDDDIPDTPMSPEGNGGFDGGGVMGVGPSSSRSLSFSKRRASQLNLDGDKPCKAFWVMGRKWTGGGDGGAKMLDSFLELKMENERLRQELRELRERPRDARTSFCESETQIPQEILVLTSLTIALSASTRTAQTLPSTYKPSPYGVSSNYPSGSHAAQQSYQTTIDSDEEDNYSNDSQPDTGAHAGPSSSANRKSLPGGGDDKAFLDGEPPGKKPKKVKPGKNPEYLCRNCGRNDSPEWRKGPLGAKTLCNVSWGTVARIAKLPPLMTACSFFPGLWTSMGEEERCPYSSKEEGEGRGPQSQTFWFEHSVERPQDADVKGKKERDRTSQFS